MKKNKSIKKWIGGVALVLVVALLAALPMLSTAREDTSDILTTIKTAQLEKQSVATQIIGGGQLSSDGVSHIKIPENVKLTGYAVGNGDSVKAGDKLADVDKVSVMTAITEVQATLEELSSQIQDAANSSTTQYLTAATGGTVKKVYAKTGDSVQDVMLQYGALAIISLDDTMAVTVETDTKHTPGEKIPVILPDGTEVTGRIKSCAGGEMVVTVADKGYAIGTNVTVRNEDGAPIGSGELYVYSAWNVTAYDGEITYVSIREQQTIYSGTSLITLKTESTSGEFQKLVDKRQKYETLMQELFTLYNDGAIFAPCDGIVSGVDTDGAYMLSAEGEEQITASYLTANTNSEPVVVLLSNRTISEPAVKLLSNVSNDSGSVAIATGDLSGVVGDAFSTVFSLTDSNVTGGTWAISQIPSGLSLDETSGTLSGTPNAAFSETVTISYSIDEENVINKDIQITIAEKTQEPVETYTCVLCQVTAGQMDAIQVKYVDTPYTTTDPNKVPTASADPSSMSGSVTVTGAIIAKGNFKVGDIIWLVYDSNSNLVNAVLVSGSGSSQPGGNMPGGNMPGASTGGGMPSGSFSGGGGMSGMGGYGVEEDDGLYSLDKVTIADVTSQENMTVSVTFDELDITSIYVGQKAVITMNSLATEPVEAVVTGVSNSGENSGGNSKFTVDLELSKSSEMLPGMNATATITLATKEDAMCIPSAALSEQNGKTVVYTGYDAEKKQLLNPVEVTIGTADADHVEILSGLSAGTEVYYEVYETNDIPSMPALPGGAMPS